MINSNCTAGIFFETHFIRNIFVGNEFSKYARECIYKTISIKTRLLYYIPVIVSHGRVPAKEI